MKIQIITDRKKFVTSQKDIHYASISAPAAFDMYDVNIVDLQCPDYWKNDSIYANSVNIINDFNSLGKVISAARASNVVILLAQNYLFQYSPDFHHIQYERSKHLKDMLTEYYHILAHVLPGHLINSETKQLLFDLRHEISKTRCGDMELRSEFTFSLFPPHSQLTTPNSGNGATTFRVPNRNTYLTTLEIKPNNPDSELDAFLTQIGILKQEIDIPDWLKAERFFDDEEQERIIDENQKAITVAQERIQNSEKKLKENLKFKSMLSETGENLVVIVDETLEKMLDCDLSHFVDEKKEDFLIKKEEITFIGEIKGISSNVRSENVSQLDTHYQGYKDKLEEAGKTENVKALLIINPLRKTPASEREGVHDTQIKLAERNGSLIITTQCLLAIYEQFLRKELSKDEIIELLSTKTGLLKIEDFNHDKL